LVKVVRYFLGIVIIIGVYHMFMYTAVNNKEQQYANEVQRLSESNTKHTNLAPEANGDMLRQSNEEARKELAHLREEVSQLSNKDGSFNSLLQQVSLTGRKRVVYDTFIFGWELDMLEVHLHTLADYVDYFVIAEGPETFTVKPKPLVYWENQERFKQFAHKIIHVNCTWPAGHHFPSAFHREGYGREECMFEGLKDAHPEDIVMHGDVDQIVRPGFVNFLRYAKKLPELPAIVLHLCYYYNFHWKFLSGCASGGTRIHTVRSWRNYGNRVKGETLTKIHRMGWHCSSCLTIDDFMKKLSSFSHTEFDTPNINNPQNLQDAIDKGIDYAHRGFSASPTDTPGDIPMYIVEHLDRFGYMVPHKWYPNISDIVKEYDKMQDPKDRR